MKFLPVLLLMILASCSGPPQPDAPAAEAGLPRERPAQTATDATIVEEPVEPRPGAAPSPPAVANGNVTIESVGVGNPLAVSGRARTFENNVALRARAADGSLIVESFTTATGEMGQFSPYRGTLWLTRDPGPRVIIEALEYSARDGSEQSLVRAERPFDMELIQTRLFFPDRNCTGVTPYTRRVPKTVSMARLLVEALVAGPTAEEGRGGASHPFPRGSRVESVNLREGTLTVDFNGQLQNVGGSCAAQMIRASVTETLRQLPTVKKVVITAAGSEALALQP